MIVVLSLNTAVDRILKVPGFVPGTVMRASDAQAFAGGKGLNVARNIRRLRLSVRTVGFLGGSPRAFIEERCAAMGIEAHWISTRGETRTCTIVVDPEAGAQTVVNEQGPEIKGDEIERLVEELKRCVHAGDMLCISGSAPPGVPDAIYGEIVELAQGRGARVLVDASGGALRSALEASPWAIAPNEEEARSVVEDAGSPEDLARALLPRSRVVLLTLGREGCIVARDGALWRARAPSIHEANAVGSGDAFVAGFLASIERGRRFEDAIRTGVACGASNAARMEPGIGTQEEIAALEARVTMEPFGAHM